MADSLYFTGERTVTKHKGSELTLLNPKRGGNTHLFPQWWGGKHKVLYVKCAIFSATMSNGGLIRLVIPVEKETVELDIRYDGDGNFTFPRYLGVERVAVVAEDSTDLRLEDQFPTISGGSVLKRTVGSLPTTAPTIGTVTVTGDDSASIGDEKVYTVGISGDATQLTYAWTVPGEGGEVLSGAATSSATIKFLSAGDRTPQCTVSSTDIGLSGPSSTSADITVTVS